MIFMINNVLMLHAFLCNNITGICCEVMVMFPAKEEPLLQRTTLGSQTHYSLI